MMYFSDVETLRLIIIHTNFRIQKVYMGVSLVFLTLHVIASSTEKYVVVREE